MYNTYNHFFIYYQISSFMYSRIHFYRHFFGVSRNLFLLEIIVIFGVTQVFSSLETKDAVTKIPPCKIALV